MSGSQTHADAQAAAWEETLLQAGELLLNGWGFNWYRAENLMRADDILLRNRADQLLGEAQSALRQAEAAFRTAHLPPPSRAQPLPDGASLAELRAFRALVVELDSLRTAIRGAAMPPDDKIWRRHRDEPEMLARLGRCDATLAAAAQALQKAAAHGAFDGLNDAAAGLEPHLVRLRMLLELRRELMAAPER